MNNLRYYSGLPRPDKFRVGITPDFYTDAKGYFEEVIEQMFSGVPGFEYGPCRSPVTSPPLRC